MTPELTEAWGAAYLQVLVVLLTFAFGIPSIILHVTLPEEIQHVFHRYMKRYLLFHLCMVMLLLIFSLSFIWCLHPVSTNPSDFPPSNNLLGTLFMTCALAIIPISLLINFRTFRRKAVVNYLGRRIYKKFCKYGPISDEELTDLITLGERSDAGYEKMVVLEELDKLMGKIQNSDLYSGNDLELILRNFDKIVTGIGKPGNNSDFIRAVDILEKIIGSLSARKFSSDCDKILIYWSLKEIGKKAAELRFSRVILRIVQAAASNSGALFEIGLSAFNNDNYSAATAALCKLETLALKTTQDNGHCANDLFGLLAHFWTGNRSARRCAEESLNSLGNQFSPLEQYLYRAIEDHYSVSRFDTADKLMIMRNEIVGIRGQ